MSDILREIDEDLKREQMEQLWKRYGKYALTIGVVIVVATSAAMFYKSKVVQDRMVATDHLIDAVELVEEGGDTSKILTEFDNASAQGQKGVALLADFQKAAYLSQEGKATEAVEIYKSLMTKSSVPQRYQDLATVLYAQQKLNALEEGEAQDILKSLKDITVAPNPWRHSAQELSAMLHLQSGDYEKAVTLLENLSADTDAPAGIRNRSKELASYYRAQKLTN